MRDGNFRRAVEVNSGYSGLKSEGDYHLEMIN